MQPKWHILIGFTFAFLLIQLFNISLIAGLAVFLSSFLIDLDHAFRYTLKTRNINPFLFHKHSQKRAKIWLSLSKEQRKSKKYPIYIFHGIEFIFLLIILSSYFSIFFWILLGAIIHLIADYSFMISNQEPLDVKFSQIYNLIRNPKKEKFD